MKKTKKATARSDRKQELVDALLRQVVGGEGSDDSSGGGSGDSSGGGGCSSSIGGGIRGSCW